MLQHWPSYKQLLQRSNRPILVGPWRGEVGFEALYWVPWLNTLGIAPERLIPITRGGAHCWYPCREGVELYGMVDPQAVRVENGIQGRKNKQLKQIAWTDFDREIVKRASTQLVRLGKYHTLHPHWMFNALAPFWEGQRGIDWLRTQVAFTPMPAPPLPQGLNLPEKFVAVRFYLRHTLPNGEATLATVKSAIKQIAQHTPVVLLNPGIHADEHVDVDVFDIPNVVRLADIAPITPQNNLMVLSAVLARAQAFVGTYGGLAQLALRYGRPSVSFFLQWGGTMMAHKHLADAISLQTGIPFVVLALSEMHLVRAVVPDLVVELRTSGSSGVPPSTAA